MVTGNTHEEQTGQLLYKSEMSRVLGFYDFASGPKVVSPWHTGMSNPEVVEVHESIHRDLANTTSTGVVCKVLAQVLSSTEDLPEDITLGVHNALSVLLEEALLPHEAAATYLAFKVFFNNAPGEAATYLRLLPSEYVAGLSMIEGVVGSVQDDDHLLLVTQPIVLAVAKVSLSPPSILKIEDFPSCDTLTSYYREHSPNARFKVLANCLTLPESQKLSETAEQHLEQLLGEDWRQKWDTDEDIASFLAAIPQVNDAVLQQVAGIAARNKMTCSVDEGQLIEDMKSLLRGLDAHLSRKGITVLSNVDVRDNRRRDVLDTVGVDLSVPSAGPVVVQEAMAAVEDLHRSKGLELPRLDAASASALMPKDTSFRLPYVPLAIDKAHEYLQRGWNDGERWFFNISPWSLPDEIILTVSIGAYAFSGVDWENRRPDLRGAKLKAFSFQADLQTFLNLIENVPPQGAVIKMDERFGKAYPDVLPVLRDVGSPFFCVVHDTTVGHIKELLADELGRCDRLAVMLIALGALSVVVIGNSDDAQYIVSPVAKAGYELLHRGMLLTESRIDVLSEKEGCRMSDLRLDEGLLRELLFTTYLLPEANNG